MIKWQAFKTMPEQYERLEQYILDQNKIERPILSEDQLNSLNEKLTDKMFNVPYVEIKYFEEGYINEMNGYVHKGDVIESVLQLSINGELTRFTLLDIREIK